MIDTEQEIGAEVLTQLPDGWKWVRLGEILHNFDGRRVPIKLDERRSWKGPYPYYGASGIIDFVDDYLFDGDYLLISEDGANLIARSSPIAFKASGKFWVNNHAHVVQPKSEVLLDYVLYYLAITDLKPYVTGAAQPKLTQDDMNSIPIPLPPLVEQQRIATILIEQMTAVERARTAAKVQLKASGELPAAYLRIVFESPEAQQWPRKRLGEVCELLPSRSIATNGNTEVLTITTACLTESGFAPSGVKAARMWERDANECAISPGEILIARSNTSELVGRVAMFLGVPKGVVASDLTIRLWPGPLAHSPFLAAYLSFLFLTGYWRECAGGASGSMKKITRSQVIELYLPLPLLTQQQRIAAILNEQMVEVKRLRTTLEEQLAAINVLHSALLRRAFSGAL